MTSYKQQKFNLLREESEGYIKLVVELDGRLGPAAALDDAADAEAVAAGLVNVAQSLIGAAAAARSTRPTPRGWRIPLTTVHHPGRRGALTGSFDLDPNRVLDQMLNVFERHLEAHNVWLRLLARFNAPANTLCQIVGARLQHFQVWLRPRL